MAEYVTHVKTCQGRPNDSRAIAQGVQAGLTAGSPDGVPERSAFGAEWPSEDGPLVTTPISQQSRIELYPQSLRVKRPFAGEAPTPPDRTGSQITGFSDKSRRQLRFRALNAFPALVSQLGLTYHDEWPTDGRECKRHLNAFLVSLRRILPDANYLWIMEFQKRNAPHFHVFLSVPPDEETRLKLADAWTRLTSPGDAQALRFHQHSRNWIDWDMGSGAYLCKYLDKEAQKAVPEGYHSFGRFWGNSRGLVPLAVEIPLDDVDEATTAIDQTTGEITGGASTVIRWLGRLAEKQTRGFSRFRKRAPHGSYTILRGRVAYEQIERYLTAQRRKENP